MVSDLGRYFSYGFKHLGAARPLPPSIDIGPGGQSVGQAAQFCLVTPMQPAYATRRRHSH